MKGFRKVLSLALCTALILTCVPAGLAETTNTITKEDLANMKPTFYEVNANKWLYFGWENYDQKCISTMGGALYTAGSGSVRRYPDAGSGLRTPNYAALSVEELAAESERTGLSETDLKNFSDRGGFDQKSRPIRYTVTVGDVEYTPDETSENRRQNTTWYQADGYMNSPVSEWAAGDTGVKVKIQHVAGSVKKNNGTTDACAVFTQVTLTNNTSYEQTVVLNVGALSDMEMPMGDLEPDYESKDTSKHFYPQCDDNYALYLVTIPAEENKKLDFAATVWNYVTPKELKAMGSFDEQYAATKAYYDNMLKALSLPVSLPDEEMKNSYINSMLVMYETVVKSAWNKEGEYKGQADYQIRGSAGTRALAVNGSGDPMHGYYTYFPHDVPNMVQQFIRDGRLDLAIRIMDSPNYQTLYLPENHAGNLDAIPKFIIPYASLWQAMNETQRTEYFTDEVKAKIKEVSREVISYVDEDLGIIQKSESLDNIPYDYLITDNFTAMHGLAAYRYLCQEWEQADEVTWSTEQMTSLNTALNASLDAFMEREGVEWYMCAMNEDSGFWKRHENGSVVYDGNFLCSSLMMSTFPWDAVLLGYDLEGTWADYFEASIDNAVYLKETYMSSKIPEGSWGAWWGHEYGSVYNVGQSVPMLYSDKYRTAVVESYEWLLDNQTAPFQWAESFDRGLTAEDWTEAAIDYETWGLGFMRQGLLEAVASIKADGTVIIGRGVPNEWMLSDTPIEWQNIAIGDGRQIDNLKLYAQDAKTVKLELTGDDATNNIVLDLMALKDNVTSVSVGTFDNETGTVTLPANTKELTVFLSNNIQVEGGVETPENVKATANGRNINVTWDEAENNQGYVVQVTLADELIAEETVQENAYTLKDAVPGLKYAFQVKTLGNGLEESGYSDFVSTTTEMPTEEPSGEGSINITTATIVKGSTQNLTETGTLDWIKTGFGERNVKDVIERKDQDTAYLHRFYTPYVTRTSDILFNPDIGYTYSWTDGTSQASASSKTALNLGTNFGNGDALTESVARWTVTAPATSLNGNTLILDCGAWQIDGHLDIYLSDNSAEKQTIPISVRDPDKFQRHTIEYQVPEGSNASLVVTMTVDQKYHQAGNTILAAAMLQGDAVELDSLTITEPTKTDYMVGDELDLAGMSVTANYTFGDSKTVKDYTVSGYDPTKAGTQTVTVGYTENGVTKTATFDVTVTAAILKSITVNPPAKTTYLVGEPFEHSGMSITAHYENRSDRAIADSQVSMTGFDNSKLGRQTITVSYTENGKTVTDTFDVLIRTEQVALTDISANTFIKAYRVGDALNKDTLTVTAQYADGTSKTVSTYDVSELDASTKGVKTLTVTYTEEGVTKAATLEVTVVLPGDVDDNNQVEANDALLALQAATSKITLTDAKALAAEVDGDEKGEVTANDALQILQCATKKIAQFPISQ